MQEMPTIARVTSVKTRNGQVYVDVEPARPGVEEEGIPFASLAPGFMVTPKEGYWVEVYETDDGKQARFCHSLPTFSMPDLPDDSFIYRFNDGTEISAIKNTDGSYDVNINGDSTVNLNAGSGTVNVDGATINLGSGSKGVITDISTTKDADGHVTSVDVTRSTKINIE